MPLNFLCPYFTQLKRNALKRGHRYYIADRAHLNTLITTTNDSTASPMELTVVTPSVIVPTTDVTSIDAALALLISAADTATPKPYFFTAAAKAAGLPYF